MPKGPRGQPGRYACAVGIRYAHASYTDMALFASATFDAVVSFMAMMDGPRFDRTLSAYVNTLTEAGFILKRLEEPRPSEEYCRAHPGQRGWRDHVALFLHLLAEKPA